MTPEENRLIVRFSDLEDARAALAEIPPGRPFFMISHTDAVGRLGARYLLEVAHRALAAHPSANVIIAIHCGADVAAALDAIEAKAPAIVIAPHAAIEGLAAARGILALVEAPNGTEITPKP